ncbi:glycosyltransferase [Polynucleobacter antarcticus]|uniref:Glycosyltransferase subfamily 4-like N-terminal domain-containing protein n=2 Tax=Polynucleobacter antarcticus TaxID=1743162 RepID=A0A6M9PGF5_9BURK|nr:hypothetical protein DCO16_01550 [Polynucleobacter antarcticus]
MQQPEQQPIQKKHWLILSHGFNMDGRAASQTITDKIPYFLEAGVKPMVFSSITGIQDQHIAHRQFLAWGPAAFRFDFRHWVANQYGRGWFYKLTTRSVSFLLVPFIALEKLFLGYSSQWSWAMPAYVHGLKEIRNNNVDLIYSTGGAWSAHLAALWLKKKTGLPWIAEIHDPLVIRKSPQDQGFDKPINRDARFRQYLEKQLCKYADLVWWFTDGAVHYAKVRNPNLNEPGNTVAMMVIPGAMPPLQQTKEEKNVEKHSTEEQSADKQSAEKIVQAHQYSNKLHLCHFGSLAKDRSLSTILKAVNHLTQHHPKARGQIQIHAYGAPLDELSKDAINECSQNGIDDLLIAHGRLEKDSLTGKSGRERVMQAMQAADVLILLHGTDEWCAEYIPSKFYEYLWTGRPIWALSHRNPQLDAMLEERGAYISHAESEAEVNRALERIWLDWRNQQLIEPKWMPIGVDQAAQCILDKVHDINQIHSLVMNR